MIETSCGLLCSECSYKVSMNCPQCKNDQSPFWGSCVVKTCCQSRQLEHCGMCKDFACELLSSFSYDKEQGDDGKRIEQCRKWAKIQKDFA